MLEKTIKDTPTGDIILLRGDMIAQVGHINTNLEQITGVHGLDQINVNGGLFTELCAKNNLTIGGTRFPHRKIHKITWVSPDHELKCKFTTLP